MTENDDIVNYLNEDLNRRNLRNDEEIAKVLKRMNSNSREFKQYTNRQIKDASIRGISRQVNSIVNGFNGSRRSNNKVPQKRLPQNRASKHSQKRVPNPPQRYNRSDAGKSIKEMKPIRKKEPNQANKKLRRFLYSAGAVGFIASSIFAYNLGKNAPDTPLIAVSEPITQEMQNSNPALVAALERYSELVTLGNSEGKLNESSRAELFHLVTSDILPNSPSIIEYYASLTKEKIASSLGLGNDTSKIDISLDNNDKIIIQRILDNNTRQTFDISAFRNTTVYDALKELESFTANYLFTSTPSNLHDIKDMNVNKDNVIEYVNAIIGMVNHSQELSSSVLRYDGNRFSELEIRYADELESPDEPEL